jgi:galactose mutarotase-like enzyme
MEASNEIHIQSEFISATISREGAELKSLYDLDSRVEYLWQGKKAIYPWSSQLMFPIVGKLREDQYRLGRKFYRLIKDGFAKNLLFDVKSQSKDQVSLILSHDNDTLAVFPYMFSLVINFRVYGPRLKITIDVTNLDKKEMFFSVGFAPIFNIPISKNHNFDDYLIEMSDSEDRGIYHLDNELVNFNHADDKNILSNGNEIHFSKDIFKSGEFIFKDLYSSYITLKNKIDEKSVLFDFKNTPYLSIWSYPDSPFVRIAPSFGVTDAVDSNNDFYTKEGLIDLEQEKVFKFEMSILIR